MKTISIGLVAYFEDGVLRGLFELEYQKNYQVCHVTLGREPNDEETLDFLRFYFSQLILTSELVRKRHSKIKNPNLLQ